MFRPTQGSYFLMGSHLTGWAPNAPMLFHASAPSLFTATWTELPEPARGEGANITYNSQSSFVFPLEFADGTVLYIYMGDRWNFYGPGSVRSFAMHHQYSHHMRQPAHQVETEPSESCFAKSSDSTCKGLIKQWMHDAATKLVWSQAHYLQATLAEAHR